MAGTEQIALLERLLQQHAAVQLRFLRRGVYGRKHVENGFFDVKILPKWSAEVIVFKPECLLELRGLAERR